MKQVICALGATLVAIATFGYFRLSEIEAGFSTADVGTSAFAPGEKQVALPRQISMKTLPPPQTKV